MWTHDIDHARRDQARYWASGSPLRSVELRHLGGAVGRCAPGHGVLARLDGEFAIVAVGAVPEPASTARTIAALSSVTTALSPWRSGADYLNLSAPPARPERFFDPTTVTRLREVARSYAPAGLFQPSLPVAD
jgi:hypothetical protein